MTLLELQKILGDEIKAVMDGTADTDKAKTKSELLSQTKIGKRQGLKQKTVTLMRILISRKNIFQIAEKMKC